MNEEDIIRERKKTIGNFKKQWTNPNYITIESKL